MLFRLLLAVACLHHASSLRRKRKVCFDEMLPEFSCYERKLHSEGFLPESPSAQRIQFNLFTKNRADPDKLYARVNTSVMSSHIFRNGKVAFIIHGFTDNSSAPWVASLVKELLVQVPNVIAVDWSYGARGPKLLRYPQATANTHVVGAQIATMIKTMISANVGVTLGNIHLIGHSLGAHVAGYAGKKFITPQIGRITGLDPAAPNFEKYDVRVRLNPSDAEFVDVIHTSAYLLIYGGLGIKKDSGHVDFWPNGGQYMPGCQEKPSWSSWSNSKNGSCNHAKARDYFIASINDNCFCASLCAFPSHTINPYATRNNNMGYHALSEPRGSFCLNTGDKYPF